MHILRWMILSGMVIIATAPAAAQTYDDRYPICLQKWQWGGSTYFECTYTSWDQCRATAAGLAATCLENPYWPHTQRRLSAGRPAR